MGAFGKSKPNQFESNQITYRQGLPNVCVQQFDSHNEDWFWIFWVILTQFRLGIMLKEGICEVQMFGFMWSKSSNLEVCKCCVIKPLSIESSIDGSITHDSIPLASEAVPSAQLQTPVFKPMYSHTLGFASLKLR